MRVNCRAEYICINSFIVSSLQQIRFIFFNSSNKKGKAVPLQVLYGCETWSLTYSEERRLRVFENRVLRRIFWPKREEVTV